MLMRYSSAHGEARVCPDHSAAPGTPSPATDSGGPPSAPRTVPPPPSGMAGGDRLSSPPSALEGISIAACAQLLDRLAAADEAPFIVAWIESVLSGRTRVDPALAVRLLRAYRETGRIDRARELAASLPSAPVLVESARRGAARHRAGDPRDHRRPGRPRRGRATAGVARAPGRAARGRAPRAARHAPHAGAARAQAEPRRSKRRARFASPSTWPSGSRTAPGERPVSMTLGHLSMRLADPRTAAKHYATALARTPARGVPAR